MVGRAVVDEIISRNIGVVAVVRNVGKARLPSSVRTVQCSLDDLSPAREALSSCDVVIHLAGRTPISGVSNNEFERTNVVGTANIIRECLLTNKKLVHVSTVNVVGYQEGAHPNPYASTKAQAEKLILEAVKDGLDALIVRPATVFGHKQGEAGLIVDRLLARTLRILPSPSRKISPVWTVDLASALVSAAQSGIAGHIYTVAGPTMTTKEFVRAVSDSAGVPAPRFSLPAWTLVVPLQLAWWGRKITRWTPPVSIKAIRTGSMHDGSQAAIELGFRYTPIPEIFSVN